MEDIQFDFSDDDFQGGFESDRPNYLNAPYVGPATLDPAKVQTEDHPNPQNAEEVWNSMQFLFQLPDKRVFTHTEYAPDAKEKAVNTWKRVGHILNNVTGDPDASAKYVVPARSWNQLRANVREAVKDLGVKQVNIKVIGDVYEGRAKIKFPGYVGFIAEPGEALSFSRSEVEGNRKFLSFQQASPTEMGGDGSGEGVAPAPTARATF